jgi:hypothetical protein
LWPAVETKKKRGITLEEHQRIIAAEKNVERRLYYEFLWETVRGEIVPPLNW